jgi:hypothetical protein
VRGWILVVCVSLGLCQTAVASRPSDGDGRDSWPITCRTAIAGGALRIIKPSLTSVKALVADGCRGSETFRVQIRRLEGSRAVVFVQLAPVLQRGFAGETMGDATVTPDGTRCFHVAIVNRRSFDSQIATLGHELQHVAEAVDTIDLTHLDRGVARQFAWLSQSAIIETPAAIEVGQRVSDELSAWRRID